MVPTSEQYISDERLYTSIGEMEGSTNNFSIEKLWELPNREKRYYRERISATVSVMKKKDHHIITQMTYGSKLLLFFKH